MRVRKKSFIITLIFLLFYVCYAILYGLFKESSEYWRWIPLIPVAGMVVCIFYTHTQQDEFVRRIVNMAYVLAFWLILVLLLLVSFQPTIKQWLLQTVPLWSLPLMAWIFAYAFSWLYHS